MDEGAKFYHPLAVASDPQFGSTLEDVPGVVPGSASVASAAVPDPDQPPSFMTPQPVQGGRPISVFQRSASMVEAPVTDAALRKSGSSAYLQRVAGSGKLEVNISPWIH